MRPRYRWIHAARNHPSPDSLADDWHPGGRDSQRCRLRFSDGHCNRRRRHFSDSGATGALAEISAAKLAHKIQRGIENEGKYKRNDDKAEKTRTGTHRGLAGITDP